MSLKFIHSVSKVATRPMPKLWVFPANADDTVRVIKDHIWFEGKIHRVKKAEYKDRKVIASSPRLPDDFFGKPISTHNVNGIIHTPRYGVDIVLIPFTEIKRKPSQMQKLHRDKCAIFVDSGGSQFNSGTVNFINPYELSDCYNKYADFGVALDMPMDDSWTKAQLNTMVKVQRCNNEIMEKVCRPEIFLLNVIKGKSLEGAVKWYEETHIDRFKGLSLGTWYEGTVENMFNEILPYAEVSSSLIQRNKDLKIIHVLGKGAIRSSFAYCMMAYFLRQTYGIQLAVDTSYGALTDVYSEYIYMTHEGKVEKFYMGDRKLSQQGKVRSSKVDRLNCPCEVCSALAYKPLMMTFRTLLPLHSVYTMTRHIDFINGLITSCFDGKDPLNRYVKEIIGIYGWGTKVKSDLLRTCMMLKDVIVDKKFKKVGMRPGNLFGTSDLTRGSEYGKGATLTKKMHERKCLRVIERYRRFHNITETEGP